MCSTQQVMKAVGSGMTKADEFLAVVGVYVWVKDKGAKQGIEGELELRNFEMVSGSVANELWSILKQQRILTPQNLEASLRLSEEAWQVAGKGKEQKATKNTKKIKCFTSRWF